MWPVIENPVTCKIHTVINFLFTKNVSAAEIHCEVWVIYGQNVMSERTIRQWCEMFKDGWTDIHNEEQSE
jgi:hypothetical protein